MMDVPSPHIPLGSGKTGEDRPAIFLNQAIENGYPYYSAQFPTFLGFDRRTKVNTPLERGQWSLIDVYVRSDADADIQKVNDTYQLNGVQWQRTSDLDLDLKFNSTGADVFGFYKAHLQATQETPPTQGNSQRKVARLVWEVDSIWYHAVYTSGGKIWYTWTEDNGDTWQPEVLISNIHHIAGRPSIAIKNESNPLALNGAMLYITYVDETDGSVVLKSRKISDRPDLWYPMDAIQVVDPLNTHPVVDAISLNAKQYTMLVYEGDSTLQYSLYHFTQPLLGQENGAPIVSFRDRVLVDGYVNWRGRKYQPTLPNVAYANGCQNNLDFDIVWREGDLGSMRKKRVTIDEVVAYPDLRVINPPATFVPGSGLYIASHAGPSMTSTCLGGVGYSMIAYEYVNQGTFPSPASIPSQGMSLLGRTFMPVTSHYPGGSTTSPTGQNIPGNRVAIVRHMLNQHSNPITQVVNLPYSGAIRPEPSVNISPISGTWMVMASMNFTSGNDIYHPKIATVKFPLSMPSSISAQLQTDGYYPSLAVGYKPLQIHCGPEDISAASYASPSPIPGHAIQYNVFNTTQGLNKSTSLEVSDPMREIVIRKNDSSYAIFGVVKPHVINAAGDYTEVAWHLAADSIDVLWWKDIPTCIRTTTFSVPTDGAFEYGTELFAAYPDDLDSCAVIQVQFRHATTNAVMLSSSIDMSGYAGDTAVYVLDRHDLSEIAGQNIYMCLNPVDTLSAASWEVQVITALDTVQQEKAMMVEIPVPSRISLRQNTPNPFHPSTTIQYGLEEDCHVGLHVYDQFGRRVTTLVEDSRPAGWHQVRFDAGSLPDGVYYFQLNALDQVQTKRMILLRR